MLRRHIFSLNDELSRSPEAAFTSDSFMANGSSNIWLLESSQELGMCHKVDVSLLTT